jgi:hypothetical protein
MSRLVDEIEKDINRLQEELRIAKKNERIKEIDSATELFRKLYEYKIMHDAEEPEEKGFVYEITFDIDEQKVKITNGNDDYLYIGATFNSYTVAEQAKTHFFDELKDFFTRSIK